MKFWKHLLLATVMISMTTQTWAYMNMPDNKPLHIYWENHPLKNYPSQESELPQIIKTAFHYEYGYYYKPPGSPFPVYQPYMRAIRTRTGIQYVPTAIIRYN